MKFQTILQNLNSEQKQAAETLYGATQVVAGAGTGKTQMVMAYIVNLLQSDVQAQPEQILCLTYTDAGVVAMRKRLVETIGVTGYRLPIHTFHSFCNEVIQFNKDYYGVRDMEVVTEIEQMRMLAEMIDELPQEHPLKRAKGDLYFDVDRLRDLFAKMKEENWDHEIIEAAVKLHHQTLLHDEAYQYKRGNSKKTFPKEQANEFIRHFPDWAEMREQWANEARGIEKGDPKIAVILDEVEKMELTLSAAKLFKEYLKKMKQSGRYEFADMLGWVIKMFKTAPHVLLAYQERYQWIVVDEFQDTNGVQMDLLRSLLSFWDDPNILAVGDDDQTLYSFAGARIRNLMHFKDEYKPQMVNLTTNYRSGQNILNHANKVITYNTKRLKKDEHLVAHFPIDAKVRAVEFSGTNIENAWLIEQIENDIKGGMDLDDIAVIYRKHRQAEDILKQLLANNISIKIKKRLNVLHTYIVMALTEMLSYYINENTTSGKHRHQMFKVMGYPWFGLPHKDIKDFMDEGLVKDNKAMKQWISVHNDLLDSYRKKTFIDWVLYVINRSGMFKYIIKSENSHQYLHYVTSFFNWIKSSVFRNPYYNGEDLLRDLQYMKERGISIPADELNWGGQGITFSSCHGVKGLEFKKVYLIGALAKEWEKSRGGQNKFKLPPQLLMEDENDKEESNRRLFYVSITRAKESLVITYSAKDSEGRDTEKTKFIDEAEISVEKGKVEPKKAFDIFSLGIKEIKLDNPFYNRKQIEERLENYVTSVSHVNKYLRCKVAFFFENILGVPFVASEYLVFGNAVHIALKQYYDEARRLGKHHGDVMLVDSFTKYLEENTGQLGQDAVLRLNNHGKKVLKSYYNTCMQQSNIITLNEFHVNRIVLPNDVPIKGDIDKLEFDGNYVDVLDYKTGKLANVKRGLKPHEGEYFRQGVVYKLMVDLNQSKPWRVRDVFFEVIDEDYMGRVKIDIIPKNEKAVLDDIKRAYDGIMSMDFHPGCGEKDCEWCNYVNQLNI